MGLLLVLSCITPEDKSKSKKYATESVNMRSGKNIYGVEGIPVDAAPVRVWTS